MRDVVKREVRPPQRRRKRRRRNLSLYYLMILIFVTACLLVLSMTVFFNVESIEITGESSYSDEQICEAAGISEGDNLLRMNASSAETRILRALNNIETVKLEKMYPSTLRIIVEPSLPSFNIEFNGQFAVISQNGKVLYLQSKPYDGLLTFYGFEAEEAAIGAPILSADEVKSTLIYDFHKYVEEIGIKGIDKIDITDRYNITYIYDGRITVELGSINELYYKLKFADETITEKLSPKAEGTVNVMGEFASFISKQSMEKYEANKAALSEQTEAQTDENGETVDTSAESIQSESETTPSEQ